MQHRFVAPLLGLLLLSSAARPAAAWSDAVNEHVAEQAGRLMPDSLESILAQNITQLRDGARAGARWNTGRGLDATILAQSQRVLDMLSSRAPMADVVREMGVLSGLVSLADDPVRAAGHDPATVAWSDDFERYTE